MRFGDLTVRSVEKCVSEHVTIYIYILDWARDNFVAEFIKESGASL